MIVKFLEKIISVSIIRDIEESYLVPKNPMPPLGVEVSEMYGESKMVQEELTKEGLKKVLIIVMGKKDIYTVNLS